MKPFLIAFLLCASTPLFAQFCTTSDRFTEVTVFEESEIDFQLDVTYGQAVDNEGNMVTLQADFFYPSNVVDTLTERPAIMIIHGGGFQGGSKEGKRSECIDFAQRGFVAMTINYRLGWDTSMPEDQILAIYRAQQDAQAAMRFMFDQAPTYGIDTNWVFIGGSSAGAITANNVVYGDQQEWEFVVPGIETMLGSLDTSTNALQNTYDIKGIYNNWGAVFFPFPDTDEYRPQIGFHGGMDNTVPIDSSDNGLLGTRIIHQKLQAAQICGDLTVEPMGGHGIYRGAAGDAFRVSKASCFFKSLFCETCSSVSVTDSIETVCSSMATSIGDSPHSVYRAFPNPTVDLLQIEGLTGQETFTLISPMGQLIMESEAVSTLSMKGFATGLYLLHIRQGSRQQILRIMKQ